MRLHTPWLPIILFSVAACGESSEEFPKAPQIITDRDEMAFNREFGSGTYIGTENFNSVSVTNKGQDTLEITDIVLSGPSDFRIKLPEGFTPGTPLQVATNKRVFIEVGFKPREAREYTGSITIKSNAGNLPEKVVTLNALGIQP
ncbi:hypothetical protein LZ198_39885 [Myxococcus sp. K15C18031901]|uniref:hypothetical protein n=1 Tax=Myxococcus dinghuensis TaxID=2906761 RepID=UPI0020A7CC8A|nr:hypothetical protein [Myxococcus dinghuensis]MCP3105045.1 hypothetical protein [Myxococcus dinghuensis]